MTPKSSKRYPWWPVLGHRLLLCTNVGLGKKAAIHCGRQQDRKSWGQNSCSVHTLGTPKLFLPNGAWRAFRKFCCLPQLPWSQRAFCCEAFLGPAVHDRSPVQAEQRSTYHHRDFYMAFFDSSSLKIQMQIIALIIQGGQQAAINESIID